MSIRRVGNEIVRTIGRLSETRIISASAAVRDNVRSDTQDVSHLYTGTVFVWDLGIWDSAIWPASGPFTWDVSTWDDGDVWVANFSPPQLRWDQGWWDREQVWGP